MPRLPPKHKTPHRPSRQQDRRDYDRRRDSTKPSSKWKKTSRWQTLREVILLRDLLTCQMCGRIEVDTSKLVADHIVPHREDWDRFWTGALQTLCQHCHSSEKQRMERSGRPRRQRVGADGWPTGE